MHTLCSVGAVVLDDADDNDFLIGDDDDRDFVDDDDEEKRGKQAQRGRERARSKSGRQ